MGDTAPSLRRGDEFSSPYSSWSSSWSSSRSSGSSVAGGSDLENRPFDPRSLAVPDMTIQRFAVAQRTTTLKGMERLECQGLKPGEAAGLK